jgi:hypothetical protein
VFVERPAGTLEPYGLQTQGSYPHSISRGCVVERAPALSGPLPALGAFAVAALAGPLDLGRGPLERGADLVGLDLGHRPLVTLGVSQLRWRSRPMTITRSPWTGFRSFCRASWTATRTPRARVVSRSRTAWHS